MKQENLSQRILSKVETKIAIANFQKEEKKMSKNKILKMVATFVITIGVMMGVAYAGSVIYERIWKEPQRVILEEKPQITPEIVDKNITEEKAKEIAKNKLIQLGIQGQICRSGPLYNAGNRRNHVSLFNGRPMVCFH